MATISGSELKIAKWHTIALSALAFWFSSSLILDFLIMPGLYAAGVMSEADFATAGYSIFWIFNRIELLCAALALTGVLVLQQTPGFIAHRTQAIALAIFLLIVPLMYTYVLTPEMSALGLHLDLFNLSVSTPSGMNQMHGLYGIAELSKLIASGIMLSLFYRNRETSAW